MKEFRFAQKIIFGAVLCLLFASTASAFIKLQPEAGYIVLKDIEYTLNKNFDPPFIVLTTQQNIFYSFFPADDDSDIKPLFVMLNGGPGAATVANLFAMNTAPYTLDRERVCGKNTNGCDIGFAENKYSWTSMGNLLYIDAPNTGFSYLVAKNHNGATRLADFMGGNFNPFIDADQVVRVILRFLAQHEEIQANEVILVGESYGGTRVSTMLNMLLFSQRYAEDGTSVFRDQGLVDEIADHFKAVDARKEKGKKGDSNSTRPIDTNSTDSLGLEYMLTPERVAEQFGRQILIQPSLTGRYQDEVQGKMYYDKSPYHDTVIKDIALETHRKFPTSIFDHFWAKKFCAPVPPVGSNSNCVLMYYMPKSFKRDGYNYIKTKTWSDDLEAFASRSLRNYEVLKTILKYDPKDIPLMHASARKYAFKSIDNYKPVASSGQQKNAGAAKTQNTSLPAKTGDEAESGEATADALNLQEALVGAYGPELSEKILKMKGTLSPRFLSMVQEDQNLTALEAGLGKLPGETLEEKFGKLNKCDTYMDPMNSEIYLAFLLSSGIWKFDLNADMSHRYGDMFLENVQVVKTFLTDARQDLVIYSRAIPEALKKHNKVVRTVSRTRGTDHKPGDFSIVYKDGVYKKSLAKPKLKVDLYYPYYSTSGHSVSSEQPDKLLKDVKEWLSLKPKN